jgi:hypothetical protein
MPSSTKSAAPAKDKDRRKSGGKPSLVSTLKVSPDKLRKIVDPSAVKEETPAKESAASPTLLPTVAVSSGENASESTPGTPAGTRTPSQVPMGPPAEGSKKKGVKRSAPGANGSESKVRGKPGPKKKPRL